MNGSVFVTGGSGLLGVNWAAALRERCAVALGLHERTIVLRGVETRHNDLESVEGLARLFEETRCSLVVHTAGMTNVEACESNPARAGHVNVQLPVNVATACARLGIALAHISTDHLFSGNNALMTENDPVTPMNVYGRTKAEAELRVLDAYPEAVVVRTNFYGWGPSYRRSFSDTIIAGLRKGERLSLFWDVTYTPILMDALISAVHGLVERKASGIFHVTGDDRLSKYDFGVRVARRFGLDEQLITRSSMAENPEFVKRPSTMTLSNRKASSLLGRRLGGLDEHLALLQRQEHSDAVKEIQSL